MVMALLVTAVLLLAPQSGVTTQVTILPLVNEDDEKVLLLVPTLTPLTFH